MSGAALGLIFGLGILLIAKAYHDPQSAPNLGISKAQTWFIERKFQAGIPQVTLTAMLLAGLSAGIVLGVLGGAATKNLTLGILLAAGGVGLPWVIMTKKASRIRRARQEIWPDVVDNILAGVRAGISLPEVLAELSRRGPKEIRSQFAQFAKDIHASGRFDQGALLLKERCADPVADRIIEALRLAHRLGGSDLIALLKNLSHMLRVDQRTRAEMQARRSWIVGSARLAAAAPWVVLGFLTLRTEGSQAFASSTGVSLILFGAVITMGAYWLMLKIGGLPEDSRNLV